MNDSILVIEAKYINLYWRLVTLNFPKSIINILIGFVIGGLVFGGLSFIKTEIYPDKATTEIQYENGYEESVRENNKSEEESFRLSEGNSNPVFEKMIVKSIDISTVTNHQLDKKIGVPNETIKEGYESTSGCYEITTLKYDGFQVIYYKTKVGTEYTNIIVTGKEIRTIRDIGIKSSIEDVRNAYGTPFYEDIINGAGSIAYGDKLTRVIFYFKDNKVVKYGIYQTLEC